MATNRPRHSLKKGARATAPKPTCTGSKGSRLARAIREGIAVGEDNARLADEAKQIGLSAEI